MDLVDGSGQNVCYYTMQYNSYQYGNQLLAYTVPSNFLLHYHHHHHASSFTQQ
jgi:hypothetical protein